MDLVWVVFLLLGFSVHLFLLGAGLFFFHNWRVVNAYDVLCFFRRPILAAEIRESLSLADFFQLKWLFQHSLEHRTFVIADVLCHDGKYIFDLLFYGPAGVRTSLVDCDICVKKTLYEYKTWLLHAGVHAFFLTTGFTLKKSKYRQYNWFARNTEAKTLAKGELCQLYVAENLNKHGGTPIVHYIYGQRNYPENYIWRVTFGAL